VLLLFAVAQLLALALNRASAAALGSDSPRAQTLATLAAQGLWIGCGLLLAALTFRFGLRRGMGLTLRHWPWDIVRGAVGFLIVFPICIGLLHLTAAFFPSRLVEHPMLENVREFQGAWRAVVVVSAVVLAPLAEEIFFRGLLQSMLRRYSGDAWVAIAGSSAVFAAAHFAVPHTLPALFALGVVLGYNYERTGRLLAPVLIHVFFNAANIAAALTGD
jgi:membrane protease YdiL (CAAX protease family)